MNLGLVLGKKCRVAQGDCTVVGTVTEVNLDTFRLPERSAMMEDNMNAAKVGDLVYSWELDDVKFNGCEFIKEGSETFKITKVPAPKPPAEPMTRGAVVTIEGDDEFIALRFTGADDWPGPFLAVYTVEGHEDSCSWQEIVYRAAGRKIIVHKMVDPNGVPNRVDTYSEWLTLPKDELSKYEWLDTVGDPWIINDQSGEFEVYGVADGIYTLGAEYFPLTRDEDIG